MISRLILAWRALWARPTLRKIAANELQENSYVFYHHRLLIIRLQGELDILNRQDLFLRGYLDQPEEPPPAFPKVASGWGNLEGS